MTTLDHGTAGEAQSLIRNRQLPKGADDVIQSERDLAVYKERSTLSSRMMRRSLRLSIIVGEAVFIAFVGSVVLVLGAFRLGLDPEGKSAGAELVFLATALFPTIAAAGWLLRKLRTVYTRREARAMSIAFGVLTPIFLGISMVFGEISGGYAEALVGRPLFGTMGAFVGALLLTTLLSLLVCALVLRVTKLTIDVEKNDSSTLPN